MKAILLGNTIFYLDRETGRVWRQLKDGSTKFFAHLPVELSRYEQAKEIKRIAMERWNEQRRMAKGKA